MITVLAHDYKDSQNCIAILSKELHFVLFIYSFSVSGQGCNGSETSPGITGHKAREFTADETAVQHTPSHRPVVI